MIAVALAFLAGGLSACFLPDRVQGVVRGAWGWVWARVRPAPAPVTQPLYGAPMVAERVDIGSVVSGFFGFLWHWRKLIAIALVAFIAWRLLAPVVSFVTCPFGGVFYCMNSRAELRQENADLRGEVQTQMTVNERNTVIADVRAHVATARNTLNHLAEQGHAEIAAVTPAVEEPLPADIAAAWRANIDRLCEFPRADGSFPDTCRNGDPS